MTIPNTQTVGQSLTLECEGTTVRGITSGVEIVWRRGDTRIQTTRVKAAAITINNLLVYSDSYTISQLSTSDDDIEYRCRLAIHSSPVVRADAAIILHVTSECFPKMNIFLHKLYCTNVYHQ